MRGMPERYVTGLPRPARALVMGVVNTTPDSFSDGGLYLSRDRAVARGRELVAEGADLVDVGGESTRPGAERVPLDEELRRVVPVVAELAGSRVLVSVDTMRAEVARQAVAAGAVVVNDVSGGRADPLMLATVAELGVPYVLMHWRAHSTTMQQHATYADVPGEVTRELAEQLDRAVAAGIEPDRIALDPGIGFSKTAEQNWEVLAHLDALHALGRPVLVAASRKRFLGELLAEDGELRAPVERDDASAATSALAAYAGAWCVRVHTARPSADAVRVAARWGAGARRPEAAW
jgi:dihydropteroate synthase